MNRLIEIAAMAIGGLSLFLVCFVGFASLAGKDMSQVAVICKLFPAPPEDGEQGEEQGAEHADGAEAEHGEGLSDAAVIEASLGVLSAWTLPSPYSTSELRVLSEELKKKRAELEEHQKMLEEMRSHLESLQQELLDREVALTRQEDAQAASKDAGWAEIAGVIGALEESAAAAKKLQEFEPAEAAKILRALGDDTRAGEILNAVDGARWKDYVAAYTAEKARAGSKKK